MNKPSAFNQPERCFTKIANFTRRACIPSTKAIINPLQSPAKKATLKLYRCAKEKLMLSGYKLTAPTLPLSHRRYPSATLNSTSQKSRTFYATKARILLNQSHLTPHHQGMLSDGTMSLRSKENALFSGMNIDEMQKCTKGILNLYAVNGSKTEAASSEEQRLVYKTAYVI